MYRIHRQATVKNASFLPQAIAHGTEIVGYINKTYPGFHLTLSVEMFGTPTLHWYWETKSLDTLQETNAKLMTDKTYWSMLERNKELWLEGSLKDTIVMSV